MELIYSSHSDQTVHGDGSCWSACASARTTTSSQARTRWSLGKWRFVLMAIDFFLSFLSASWRISGGIWNYLRLWRPPRISDQPESEGGNFPIISESRNSASRHYPAHMNKHRKTKQYTAFGASAECRRKKCPPRSRTNPLIYQPASWQ